MSGDKEMTDALERLSLESAAKAGPHVAACIKVVIEAVKLCNVIEASESATGECNIWPLMKAVRSLRVVALEKVLEGATPEGTIQ